MVFYTQLIHMTCVNLVEARAILRPKRVLRVNVGVVVKFANFKNF